MHGAHVATETHWELLRRIFIEPSFDGEIFIYIIGTVWGHSDVAANFSDK